MATKTLYDRSLESSGLRLKLTWAVTSQNIVKNTSLNDPPKMVHRSTDFRAKCTKILDNIYIYIYI